MDFLSYFQLSLVEVYFIIFTVFIASIIRGFNGFGFSATCISGFSFILPAIEIVPIILILEVLISIFMAPYVWNKIDWNLVFKVLIGIIIGSPIGLFLLKYLSPETTHLYVRIIIIFFSILLMKGYSNKNIYNNNRSNVYLSKYFPFITENKNHPLIQELIHKALDSFFILHICCYDNYKNLEINFIGSVAYFLSDEINIVAKKYNCKIGGVVKNPINNLIDFHFNKTKPFTNKVSVLSS